MEYIKAGMEDEDKEKIAAGLEANETFDFEYKDFTYKITREMMQFTRSQEVTYEEKFLPGVIEPSFGIGRVIWAIFEHSFKSRPNDAKRNFFTFPPKIAPVKCSILPLNTNPKNNED